MERKHVGIWSSMIMCTCVCVCACVHVCVLGGWVHKDCVRMSQTVDVYCPNTPAVSAERVVGSLPGICSTCMTPPPPPHTHTHTHLICLSRGWEKLANKQTQVSDYILAWCTLTEAASLSCWEPSWQTTSISQILSSSFFSFYCIFSFQNTQWIPN